MNEIWKLFIVGMVMYAFGLFQMYYGMKEKYEGGAE